MINYCFDFYGIPVYEDFYVDEDRILKGRRDNDQTYIIVNPKTAKLMKLALIKSQREKKLKRILKNN